MKMDIWGLRKTKAGVGHEESQEEERFSVSLRDQGMLYHRDRGWETSGDYEQLKELVIPGAVLL